MGATNAKTKAPKVAAGALPLSHEDRSVAEFLRRALQDSARKVRDAVGEGEKVHGDDYLEEPALLENGL